MAKIERDPLIDAAVNRLLDALAPMVRGQLIPHKAIETISGYQRYTESWNTVIAKLKRRMLQTRGIELWSRPGEGYKLSTIEEQLGSNVQARYRKMKKQAKLGGFGLLKLAPECLSMQQQLARRSQMGAMARMEADAAAEVKQVDILTRPSESMPR